MEGEVNQLKVVLVERRLTRERSHLQELENLTQAAGYTVIGQLEQVRPRNSSFQIGRGKVEELAALVKRTASGLAKICLTANWLSSASS